MIRLDKEITIEEIDQEANQDENQDFMQQQSSVNKKLGQKETLQLAQKVIRKLQRDEVPATPFNFQIYFETMLDKEKEGDKKKIQEQQNLEANVEDTENLVQLEKQVKQGFLVVKSMVQSVTSVYKNMGLIRGIVKKRVDELNNTNNPLTTTSIVLNLENDIGKFDESIENHLEGLKTDYQKVVRSLKSINEEAIYDIRFNIYNKKYLLNALSKEIETIKNHKYSCSIMAIRIKEYILNGLSNAQDRLILQKNISKLIQKTSKRSDVVAHYGDGIFIMLMKYTDIEASEQACERVSDMIYNSSFFIGDRDIDLDMEIVVSEVSGDLSASENISNVIEALPKSSKDEKYIVLQNSDSDENFI